MVEETIYLYIYNRNTIECIKNLVQTKSDTIQISNKCFIHRPAKDRYP
jgi:hypothetical protein